MEQCEPGLPPNARALDAAAGLRQSESFTRSILDNSGDCIRCSSPTGEMVLVNRPGLALMEIDDVHALVGQPWTSLWNADATLARQAIDDATARGEGRFHAFRPTIKGTPKWWDVIVTPIRDERGDVQKLVTVSRDITEQKHAEQERAQLLASERAARSEAERAARLKDDFVSTLSHEMRTLSTRSWGGRRAQAGPVGRHAGKGDRRLDRNSRRQSQMVDDLLDMSRIMSGKKRRTSTADVSSAIEEAVASAQPAADAKGVRLVKVLGSSSIVQGDPGRVQQVVWNPGETCHQVHARGGMVQVTAGARSTVTSRPGERHRAGESGPTSCLCLPALRQGDAPRPDIMAAWFLVARHREDLVEMHGARWRQPATVKSGQRVHGAVAARNWPAHGTNPRPIRLELMPPALPACSKA